MAADSPPDLFDTTTIVSLLSTVAIVLVAYLASRSALPPKTTTTTTVRFLFIWHLADALCHFVLEGSFLYHCFFSFIEPEPGAEIAHLFPTPSNYLGNRRPRIYGPQSGGDRNPFAQLWMVYARADKRWAGIDLAVVSLELLTVFVDAPIACYVCFLLSKNSPKVYFWMIVLAVAELYGGFMTFCPEWLTGNVNLDGSNFMYLWVYLVFFNCLWVVIPIFNIWHSYCQIGQAFAAQDIGKQKSA